MSEQERIRRQRQSEHDRFVREEECREISGLSRTTRWRLMKNGLFPKSRAITPWARGWLFSELMGWVQDREKAA